MRIDVWFGIPGVTASEVGGRTVAVIDVLRASSSIVVALQNGARSVIPFESAEEAIERSRSFDKAHVRLAGERRMLPIAGYDLGNSPGEFTAEMVGGRTVLLSTTNGTGALLATQGAASVLVACYLNFSVVLDALREAVAAGQGVGILCAGRERQFALEDVACAGRFLRFLRAGQPDAELNDAARVALLVDAEYGDDTERVFGDSAHARRLLESGFAHDLDTCAQIDTHPVMAMYQERLIVAIDKKARDA